MNWTRFLLAVVLSGLATTFTDWLFMGALFHKKYSDTPEIWRIKPGQRRLAQHPGILPPGTSSVVRDFFICAFG